jgi:hypothetical protein
MVWSLDLLVSQGVPGRKLSSPRFKHALAQMSAIQAVLGSRLEPVLKEWPKLPNRQCMLSGVPQSPSFLVDKLNAGFPPWTERLNGSIRHMLEYDLKERWTLEDCLQMESHPVHCLSASFTSPNCADSGESLVFVNKPDNKLVPPPTSQLSCFDGSFVPIAIQNLRGEFSQSHWTFPSQEIERNGRSSL